MHSIRLYFFFLFIFYFFFDVIKRSPETKKKKQHNPLILYGLLLLLYIYLPCLLTKCSVLVWCVCQLLTAAIFSFILPFDFWVKQKTKYEYSAFQGVSSIYRYHAHEKTKMIDNSEFKMRKR